MPLVIGPNEFTQPDYTVTYVKGDRRLRVGRIFYGPASSPLFVCRCLGSRFAGEHKPAIRWRG